MSGAFGTITSGNFIKSGKDGQNPLRPSMTPQATSSSLSSFNFTSIACRFYAFDFRFFVDFIVLFLGNSITALYTFLDSGSSM